MARVLAYAADRGVRTVAELDTPGHAFSMGLAFPNVTVPCTGVALDTDIGPINVVPLDPTRATIPPASYRTRLAETLV